MSVDFDALTLPELRARQSIKWRAFPPDVLPLWVAELDVPLAEPVRKVLADAVHRGDTGYSYPAGLGQAFAGFARRRWDWTVAPEHCFPVSDVMTGVAETLHALLARGDGVVVCPPVYRPFFVVPPCVGRPAVPVPLRVDGALDLPGIDAALSAGARAVLLCSPHNPTGRVWSAQELDALDDVTRPHDALVVSDEVHGPLTLPGAQFAPYLRDRERHAVAVVSAAKAFNLPGLKAALVVAGSERVHALLTRALPPGTGLRAGHLGVLAGIAAYDDGHEWLDALLLHLDRNRTLLVELLAGRLPGVGCVPPAASYLAWLDCSAWGPCPAATALDRARVALSEGSDFGAAGAGFARLNFGTTRGVLTAAVERLASAMG